MLIYTQIKCTKFVLFISLTLSEQKSLEWIITCFQTSVCEFTRARNILLVMCGFECFRVLNSEFNNGHLWGRPRRSNLLQKMKFVYFILDLAILADQFNNWLHLWQLLLNLGSFLDGKKIFWEKEILQAL